MRYITPLSQLRHQIKGAPTRMFMTPADVLSELSPIDYQFISEFGHFLKEKIFNSDETVQTTFKDLIYFFPTIFQQWN